MWRTLHTGRVWIMVSTVSSRVAPAFIMVAMILEVRVARMLALTPLPRPSDSTTITSSSVRTISTLSPQSSSPFLLRLLVVTS